MLIEENFRMKTTFWLPAMAWVRDILICPGRVIGLRRDPGIFEDDMMGNTCIGKGT